MTGARVLAETSELMADRGDGLRKRANPVDVASDGDAASIRYPKAV